MAQRLSRPRRRQTDRNMERRDQKNRRCNGAPQDSGKGGHRARGQGPRSKRRREKVTYRLCECRQDRAYAADWCCAWGCERGSRGSRRNHRRSRRNRLFAESAESVQSARSPNSERSGRRKSLKGRSRFSAPSAASCSRFGPWSTPTQLGASRLPDTCIASPPMQTYRRVRVLFVPRALAASADHRGRCCICLLAQTLRPRRACPRRLRALRPQPRLRQRCVRLSFSLSVCLSVCLPVCAFIIHTLI